MRWSAALFSNPREFLRKFIPAAIKRDIFLEYEIWDTAMLWTALRLSEEGVFPPDGPFMLHFCSGDRNGVQQATPRHVAYVWDEGLRLFPNVKWYATARAKHHWQILAMSLAFGCTILRVGAEDNTNLPDGTIAKDSVQLVETAVRIAKDLGLDIATVDEARKIFDIPK